MEIPFCIVLYTLLVVSCLQLFVITCAKPIPATEEAAVNKTECNCNGTNLTMMVDGHFLDNWLKFNSHHSIRHLSAEAGKLLVNYEQLEPCYYEYNNSFNWTYHRSQPVTHVLLKQLYNVFILHRRFIQEKLLVSGIDIYTNKSLNVINRELNQNIAQLYYVLNISGCDCVPEDCEQTNNAFEQLTQSTEQCFADYNLPISDVARKILNDADDLHTIIGQLYEQNPKSHTNAEAEYSFDLKLIESTVKIENKWCHY